MKSNTAIPAEQLSETNVQQLQRVYAFLLKRARQRKEEMASNRDENGATQPNHPDETNATKLATGNSEEYVLEIASERLGANSDS